MHDITVIHFRKTDMKNASVCYKFHNFRVKTDNSKTELSLQFVKWIH